MVAIAAETAAAESAAPAEPMDRAAFQALYEETAPRLRAYLRRACGNAALADDLLQETFYRILRARLPQMEPDHLRAYLYRTATSLLTDHWRRAQRERRWSLAALFGAQTHEEPQTAGDLEKWFARVKPQEQALLWMAYVEGFDHGEIASALGLREKSVRVLLFRARKKLAAVLEKQGYGPQEGL